MTTVLWTVLATWAVGLTVGCALDREVREQVISTLVMPLTSIGLLPVIAVRRIAAAIRRAGRASHGEGNNP